MSDFSTEDQHWLSKQFIFTPDGVSEDKAELCDLISDSCLSTAREFFNYTSNFHNLESRELRYRALQYLRKANLLAHKSVLAEENQAS